MRKSFVAIIILCCGTVVNAQSPAVATPAVTTEEPLAVVKHSWTKERIAWESDPFGGPVEDFDDVRRRSVDQRRVERARGAGNIGEAAKIEREMRAEQVLKARPPKPARYAFHYKVSVRNTTDKTIKSIDWDYVFFSQNTQSQTSRLQFTTEEKIGPGKSKDLNVMARQPPSKTISVYALDKSERQGLDGQVVIMRVEYTDGSFWLRP